MIATIAAAKYHVCLHPSSGSRPVSQGTKAPMTTKLAPPPAEANPAAVPLLRGSNHTDIKPIIGATPASKPMPMMALISSAMGKLGADPRKAIAMAPMVIPTITTTLVP